MQIKRRRYCASRAGKILPRSDMATTTEHPIAEFKAWLVAASCASDRDPTAMALATTDAHGMPNVRIVLLKHADEAGFVFYTNLESPKAQELRTSPRAALCFHWPETKRQVRVQGTVEAVTAGEADAYFATRPRLSQIGAWASRQSHPMAHALELEQACAGVALRYGLGDVPRPPFWSGFRVVPERIEFWSEQPFRRHERKRYTCEGGRWRSELLFP
jgi:pyridoxamine 5'-phosphate oxidase